MTCPPLWHKWHGHPSLSRPYPLIADADGQHVLKSDGFLGVCHQIPGEWFWTGFIVAHGQWHYRNWPCLQTAAWDLHRLCRDARDLGPDWVPATWIDGHLPRSVKQSKGRPDSAGSWRLSLLGNILSLRLAPGLGARQHSPWHVYWNGRRVVAKKGFEWWATESAQDAAEDFDSGNREAYRLR